MKKNGSELQRECGVEYKYNSLYCFWNICRSIKSKIEMENYKLVLQKMHDVENKQVKNIKRFFRKMMSEVNERGIIVMAMEIQNFSVLNNIVIVCKSIRMVLQTK